MKRQRWRLGGGAACWAITGATPTSRIETTNREKAMWRFIANLLC
jgi:hypothetical protein